MAYSVLPGRLKSDLTGNEYAFARDRDGSSRRSAIRQLEADDMAFIERASRRAIAAGNPSLSLAELQAGGWLKKGNP